MTAALPLPGSLAALLTVGMRVFADSPALHDECDPDLYRPRGGVAHTVGPEMVGTAAISRHAPGGVAFDTIAVDAIHDCGEVHCLWRPAMAAASEVRWIARRLLALVAEGTGPLTAIDRRRITIAATLLTQGVLGCA